MEKAKIQLENSERYCKSEIERMLKNSQTKVIMPVLTLGLIREFIQSGRTSFSDSEIRQSYHSAVREMKEFLGHDVHIGAKYEDAYGMRMSRYNVLKGVDHLKYQLMSPYSQCAQSLSAWIPSRIQQHIEQRLGIVPSLKDIGKRVRLSQVKKDFLRLVMNQIDKNPANFEIFSFAIMK
ncbi:MAG TPA: hypothetical protein VFB72_19735, partial [Verrucomicrobiae bacterium]|nr:hypothetical protein [Verrucomicrobiae bacterium]